MIGADLSYGAESPQHKAAQEKYDEVRKWAATENDRIGGEIKKLNAENDRYKIRFKTVDGQTSTQAVADIVRAYPANQLTLASKAAIYASRWKEFIFDQPRNVNMEGGILPAIWGTVVMTMVMAMLVVPFGVLAALYLREYAKAGPISVPCGSRSIIWREFRHRVRGLWPRILLLRDRRRTSTRCSFVRVLPTRLQPLGRAGSCGRR